MDALKNPSKPYISPEIMESEVTKTTNTSSERAKELIVQCHRLIDKIAPLGGNLALLRSLKKILKQASDVQCNAKKAKIKFTSRPEE